MTTRIYVFVFVSIISNTKKLQEVLARFATCQRFVRNVFIYRYHNIRQISNFVLFKIVWLLYLHAGIMHEHLVFSKRWSKPQVCYLYSITCYPACVEDIRNWYVLNICVYDQN